MFRTIANLHLVFLLCCCYCWCGVAYSQFLENGLFEYVDRNYPILEVAAGDSEHVVLQLSKPIDFYNERYDQLFINTDGIITLNHELPEYYNQQFPLEYAAIAPFYSNVDTSTNNDTSVHIFQSQDPTHLEKVSSLVRHAYTEHADYQAESVIVASWINVGYHRAKADKVNTFQTVIITNDVATFVQFIYPEHGLNWLQSETGELGLPDIRPQVGFMSADGHSFELERSGTENVKFLAQTSNIGITGNWLYQVGPLEDDIKKPTNSDLPQEKDKSEWTCAEATHGFCSIHAQCTDKLSGFCCTCDSGYYGNGVDCVRDDQPLRVIGSIVGEINGRAINDVAKMQSYIMTSNAHSYTAINPVDRDLGTDLRLVLPVASTIGWLFAKPNQDELNGFQLTGGSMQQVSTLRFVSGEVLNVNQTFRGLNYWDQLELDIAINGYVPHLRPDSVLQMADYTDEYRFVGPNVIRSVHDHVIRVTNERRTVSFQLEQLIHFENCLLDGVADPTGKTVNQKVSKIELAYFESDEALRVSMVNKIGVDRETNACTERGNPCGGNSMCVPYDDTYRCDCADGFAAQINEYEEQICVDIDECALGTPVCDQNAYCANREGGFDCICYEGYFSSGNRCILNTTNSVNVEFSDKIVVPSEKPTDATADYECYRCAQDADCLNGRCSCRQGFTGNGYVCESQCPAGQNWIGDRCEMMETTAMEVEPNCDITGQCTCPPDYVYVSDYTCRFNGPAQLVPCQEDYHCHENASCLWSEDVGTNVCVCNPGLTGDGGNCEQVEESCAMKPEICDPHASCGYKDELGKWICICENGYEGDGFHCQLQPECHGDAECGAAAYCQDNVCHCQNGYGRNYMGNCILGFCGTVICGPNAVCRSDKIRGSDYCECLPGYAGNPLSGCYSSPPPCNIQNNCGPHANCEPTEDPARSQCVCEAGYSGDGYDCVEVENCLTNPRLCDLNAKCSSTNNGLVCICNEGFYGNGSVCFERQRQDTGYLIISKGTFIVRVPLNGKNIQAVTVTNMAVGVDKDCVTGRIYWSDIALRTIVSVNINGTDRKTLITDGLESPEGIAIDRVSRRIYWTDSVKDTVEVASIDNPELRTVVISKNLENPRGIAVDPFRQKLFWSDWNRDSPKIEMSNLDGTERELLLGKEDLVLPNSLVCLEHSGELCFADAGTHKIQCIDPMSKYLRTILSDSPYPFGLAYTQNQFYWTDWTTKKLESIDENGGNRQHIPIPLLGSIKMYAMTAVETDCRTFDNVCSINNGGCADSRLCLVNVRAPSGRSCKCTPQSQNCTVPVY